MRYELNNRMSILQGDKKLLLIDKKTSKEFLLDGSAFIIVNGLLKNKTKKEITLNIYKAFGKSPPLKELKKDVDTFTKKLVEKNILYEKN